MSILYCDKCDNYIDTDFNAEHFGEEVGGCEFTFKKVETCNQLTPNPKGE